MQAGLPATDSGDYIRPEYFAIDSINSMQQQKIGDKVIVKNELTDGSGNKINVADFINPSI